MNINDIKAAIIRKQAEQKNSTSEYGNTALKVAEPVIQLPNNPADKETNTAVTKAQEQILKLKEYMRATFRKDVDYCIIPNANSKIVVLQKPGIMKVLRYLNLRAQIQVISSTFDSEKQAVSYVVKASLIDGSGQIVCESVGSACSSESRFAKAGGINCNNTILQISMLRSLRSATKMLLC